ncbi:MAG: hypothetical protein ACXQTH_03280 [Dehalococcoidia bacterium]
MLAGSKIFFNRVAVIAASFFIQRPYSISAKFTTKPEFPIHTLNLNLLPHNFISFKVWRPLHIRVQVDSRVHYDDKENLGGQKSFVWGC